MVPILYTYVHGQVCVLRKCYKIIASRIYSINFATANMLVDADLVYTHIEQLPITYSCNSIPLVF